MSITEWQKEATPERATVGVCFDRRLLSELEAVEKELEEAEEAKSTNDGMLGTSTEVTTRVKTLEERIKTLRGEVKEKTRTIVFEGIGRLKWTDLSNEHPPSEVQKKEYPGITFDPNTFYAPAIAASCIEPGLTVGEAKWMLDTLPEAVVMRITAALEKANYFGARDPFAKGFGGTTPSAPKSKPQ